MTSQEAIDIYAGLGACAALGLAAGGFAYCAMKPQSQVFGRTLIAPDAPGELALTFDDGPNPACTPRLLDLLASHQVQATFFMIGGFGEREPELVRRVASAGHLIGNHTWSHPNLALTAARQVEEELRRTSETLEQILGTAVRYFRPPFGGRRPFVVRTARNLGLTPVTWNAMTNDWEEPVANAIAGRLTRMVDRLTERGRAANIVLHDGGHRMLGTDRNPSMNAASQLLDRYSATHRFVTLDAWSSEAPSLG